MVVHRHSQGFLGAGLADHILIQRFADLARLRQLGAPGGGLFFQFLADDVVAQFHALVADEHGWTRDQLAHFMLALAAERAIENLAAVAGTPLPVVAHTLDPAGKSECVARITQGSASACRRRAHPVTLGYSLWIRPISPFRRRAVRALRRSARTSWHRLRS